TDSRAQRQHGTARDSSRRGSPRRRAHAGTRPMRKAPCAQLATPPTVPCQTGRWSPRSFVSPSGSAADGLRRGAEDLAHSSPSATAGSLRVKGGQQPMALHHGEQLIQIVRRKLDPDFPLHRLHLAAAFTGTFFVASLSPNLDLPWWQGRSGDSRFWIGPLQAYSHVSMV